MEKESKIEKLKLEIYEFEQQIILEQQEKAEAERLKKEQIAREKAEKERLQREAEAERIRLEKIEQEKLEARRIEQEKIVKDIQNNMVWTQLNISLLLEDVNNFIDLHKSEVNLLDFIELYRPVKNIDEKLIANKEDIKNIEALESFLLKIKSYRDIRYKSLLDQRAKALYELDQSKKELVKLLNFVYETIVNDPLDTKIFDLTVLYDQYKDKENYGSKIEVDEVIEKFKSEFDKIGIAYY